MSNMSKIEEIVKAIENLSVSDLVALFEALKNSFKITDDMLTVSSGSSSKGDGNEPVAATVDPNRKVSIVMSNAGTESKLALTKAIKQEFGFAISEINGILTKLDNGPVILKADLNIKEAEEVLAKLKGAIPTATIDIK